ncbi:MAG: NAD(P)H-dependent oxidoreductase subunit E [Candidatus Cloacimonetes bacterium]|nr:NAD(P)H-dependent oxidoreductase subunit E [Candidatus Cloacimonadota bacterium]MCF7814531.1 NAD(P)H-dependent oxidoreductase subunit E [Candidatus Cloacimonadota bacterium]MCF7867677.1 NAD(P)H-dependent oxidoreductase subunit E [Candidatus Cloacimonadota bacterium]MCF7883525.1 NAD(P)H-dependent oxidoreductase subunit E [Candidatus Cloacimonadota bacterium]
MDILIEIQDTQGCVDDAAVAKIAEVFGMSKVDVLQTLSFYHFFSRQCRGKYTVYLNDSAVAEMMGRDEIAEVFEEEAGCKFGSVSEDGRIGLFNTSCIGMNDQEPSAIINKKVFTNLTKEKVKKLVQDMKNDVAVEDLESDGVASNILAKGPILIKDIDLEEAIKKAVSMTPDEVIEEVKISNLKGRGGAGFPTALKWKFCRSAVGEKHYIFCNADEGEPGTFKDRVILMENPELLFAGMIIGGYAIGSDEGILYLRYEYKFLEEQLEKVLESFRERNLLGKDIMGHKGFDFDIRIQFGGGAYVCGEESALIESAEGKRGEPRDRPPFPVTKGYLQQPTAVNNVETFCSVAKIIQKGAEWYRSLGTVDSTGSKLISISGDCERPGIYEIEWGFSINDLLKMVGAKDVQAVQIGGPSGCCIGPDEFGRKLAYEDLATGGSIIVINKDRDLLKDIVLNFLEFFIEESCGSCVPCRAMTVQYKKKLEKILAGKGVKKDIDQMLSWEKVMQMNRCGLGQSACNPVIATLTNFRELYESKLQNKEYVSQFDLAAAVKESCETAGRVPNLGGSHE